MNAPEQGPPRPRIPSVVHGKNRELIEVIAPLYLDDMTVVDLTYGGGAWWTKSHQPDARFTGDYTKPTPFMDSSYDVACFDPAYTVTGTKELSTLEGHFERYGLDKTPDAVAELVADMAAGQREAARIARR